MFFMYFFSDPFHSSLQFVFHITLMTTDHIFLFLDFSVWLGNYHLIRRPWFSKFFSRISTHSRQSGSSCMVLLNIALCHFDWNLLKSERKIERIRVQAHDWQWKVRNSIRDFIKCFDHFFFNFIYYDK